MASASWTASRTFSTALDSPRSLVSSARRPVLMSLDFMGDHFSEAKL